jgi:6-phosphogluconolactonase
VITVYDDPESMSHAAAGLFVQQARQAIDDHGWFSVVLSGGHTPRRTYELLAQPPFRDRVPWPHLHAFWGDERCVPEDDARSNVRMARQTLLNYVPIPESQIHPISCEKTPHEAAVDYERTIREFFAEGPPRFDLVFLGLGANGHTASLFPDTPVLEEKEHWVCEVCVPDQEICRVTLTPQIFNQATIVAFLVAGAAKARVLKQVLESPVDIHRLPAQLIAPTRGQLFWLLDQDASRMLRREA